MILKSDETKCTIRTRISGQILILYMPHFSDILSFPYEEDFIKTMLSTNSTLFTQIDDILSTYYLHFNDNLHRIYPH